MPLKVGQEPKPHLCVTSIPTTPPVKGSLSCLPGDLMPTWNSKGSISMPVLCSLLYLHCSLASILVIRSMSWDKQETIWWKLFLAARRLDDPLRRHSDEHALQYNSRLNSPLWHKYILHFDTNTVFQFETNTVSNLRQIQFEIWDKYLTTHTAV